MSQKVTLSEIVESMDFQTDEMSAYCNRTNGKIETISVELLSAVEDGEDPEETTDTYGGCEQEIPLAREIIESNEWIELPSRFDINDYRIMENFCLAQQDPALCNRFLRAIRGSGAFRRFRTAIEQEGLLEKWYGYKKETYIEIAKDWCRGNGVEFEE